MNFKILIKIVTNLEMSLDAFIRIGHKMDKLQGTNYYSSRTIQTYIATIGKWMPDVWFSQIECARDKKIFLKFDKIYLNFSGRIYSP